MGWSVDLLKRHVQVIKTFFSILRMGWSAPPAAPRCPACNMSVFATEAYMAADRWGGNMKERKKREKERRGKQDKERETYTWLRIGGDRAIQTQTLV